MKTTGIVNKAINYIMEHIEEEISLEDVAKECNYSKYHFSRLFKKDTGENVYAFIKRLKVEQSTFRLKVDVDKSITLIGEEYGYSASNYSTVFKQIHKKSPIQFRRSIKKSISKNPFYPINNNKKKINLMSFDECDKNITIETVEDFKIIYERYIDIYSDLGSKWCSFLERYSEYGEEESFLVEQTFDDPSITDVNHCLHDIGISIKNECNLENVKYIKGGKYAVYHFEGYSSDIYTTYQNIFNVWIPESKYTIDNRYGFDRYIFVDCADNYMKIDIHIPIV